MLFWQAVTNYLHNSGLFTIINHIRSIVFLEHDREILGIKIDIRYQYSHVIFMLK
jgi:hypothetical protein